MKTPVRLLAALTALLLAAPAALGLENGVYRDKAPGYGGDVILTVVIRGGRIGSLETENTGGEKSEYYLKAESALREAILAANGLSGVDAVAGATGTSESILAAMRGILAQAAWTGAQNAAPDAARDGEEDSYGSVKQPSLTPEPKKTV